MDSHRINQLPRKLREQLPKHVREKGTQGCLWRWMTFRYTAKMDLEKGQPSTHIDRASQEAIFDALSNATVVETPALTLIEGHKHCHEVAVRRFLERERTLSELSLDQQMSLIPSTVLAQLPEDQPTAERYHDERKKRPWTYKGQENIVILYDSLIETMSMNHREDIYIRDLYRIESHQSGKRYRSFLAGHVVTPKHFLALVLNFDEEDPEAVRFGPILEYDREEDGSLRWNFPQSHTDEVLHRLLSHLSAATQLNSKLGFKRGVQKIWKSLGVRANKPFANTYYKLDVVPISLFHDVAIRRGWIDKEKIAHLPPPPSTPDVAEKVQAGPHAAVTWSDGDKIQFNVNHGHRAIVERFLATRAHQDLLAYQADDAAFQQHGQEISALLRQARIIELPWKFYWKQLEKAAVTIHNATLIAMGRDAYQVDDWASLSNRMNHLALNETEIFEECSIRVGEAMHKLDWAPEMPFPVCWLGYDLPIGGDFSARGSKIDFMSTSYNLGANVNPYRDGQPYLYGHLLTKDTVYAFFTLIVKKKHGAMLPTHKCFALVEREVDWNFPNAYSSMVLTQTMAFIEEHQIVIDQVSRKRQQKVMRKVNPTLRRKKVEPPPYYTVYIKDGLYDVKKEPVREGTRGPLTYSHDRAGGIYYKIKRGPLPLSKKDRAALLRPRSDGHGYQIFEDEEPWGEWAEAVKKRGARKKRRDEWVAILKWRRRDTVVRPDLPTYIPSVRRSEKHKEK